MLYCSLNVKEKFEGTKPITRNRKSKNDKEYNGKKKKRHTTIYKSQQRKLKIATHEPDKNLGMVYWSFDIRQGPTDEPILTVRTE